MKKSLLLLYFLLFVVISVIFYITSLPTWIYFAFALMLLGALGYLEKILKFDLSKRLRIILLAMFVIASIIYSFLSLERESKLKDQMDSKDQKISSLETKLNQSVKAQDRISKDLTQSQNELKEIRTKSAPRRLSTSQRSAMIRILQDFTGRNAAVACRLMDGESCDFALDIITVLRDAGWGVPDMITTSLNDVTGRVVLCAHGAADPAIIQALERAFKSANINVSIESVAENSVGAWYKNTVHVIVGRKSS